MDLTPLQHTVIALACTGIGRLSGNAVAGASFGIALFIGREHAQAEYRWIEQFGGHLRANMPWWGGFDYVVWDLGSLTDWIVPAVACCLLLWFSRRFKRD